MRRLLAFTVSVVLALPASAGDITLHLRSQSLKPDAGGRARWEAAVVAKTFTAEETAVILCDVWDKHWSRGATERVAAMAPRINEFVTAARAKGMTIIHAPSETMDFYKDSPARRRMIDAPKTKRPVEIAHDDPPLPIDASGGGSDTGEKPWHKAWSRQHPAIEIDPQADGISDTGEEIFNYFQQKGIKNVIILGVHTNMCVLNRSFAIKTMVRRGMNTILVRDLTDAMYNPARPPYVDHAEGTRLVVEFIEKFWCPTISSDELLGNGR